MMVLEHIANLQVLVIDRVVRAHQAQRSFVLEVLALALHVQVRFREQLHRFPTALAALLPA